MPVESTQAFAMTRRRGREQTDWRLWRGVLAGASGTYAPCVIARSGSVYKLEMIRVKATKQSRFWHEHILSLRGADRSRTMVQLTIKRRSNLGCDV
jgi:hypothetical protein